MLDLLIHKMFFKVYL